MKIPGYTLKRKLGQGGMAAVFLAEQESFGREVALKIMVPQLAREPGFAERFQREARTVAQLAHPHIITVHDVGVCQQFHYIAMEYHTGGDLGQRLKAGITPFEALRITHELADALHFAHERGIVHRDIKPDNVLFRAHNNAVILTDFGIAKTLHADNQLTQVGNTVGTPKYMSPEQARAQTQDGRADLYSLGVVLYEMLTGRLPFEAQDPVALALKHCQEPVPPLPATLARYQPLIDRLLAKSPTQRFANGQALMQAIEALQKPATAIAKPSPAAERAATPAPASKTPGPVASSKPYQAFFETAESVSGKFLFKRYQMQAHFSADDYEEFKRQFQRLMDELQGWLELRGKKAEQLHINIQAHPWIHGRIREVLTKRMENTAFGTLQQQAAVSLRLYDEQDEQGQHIVLSEAGGKAASPAPADA